jgi:type III restriction enzyme
MMKFRFDANQQYQREAIDAVVGLFESQTLNAGDYEVSLNPLIETPGQALIQNELGYGNRLVIDDSTLNKNLKTIQKKNNIYSNDDISTKAKNFTVEMETGTGKTYVYLRTIFELNKNYGFKKFIIVVPSIAIREGVLKSIEITLEHFKNLYNNVPFTYFVYDSKRVSQLRSYAAGNDMQIMIINIDAFNKKDNNIIHDTRDQMGGRKPIEFIQTTNPVVILDEPQNMESKKAKEAIASLNPLCTLRYSATHRDLYNPIYNLGPVQAFQMNLVKKISVASVLAESDPTQSYIKIEDIHLDKPPLKVKMKFFKIGASGPKLTSAILKKDDDLYIKSGENRIYENGFVVTEINAQPGREYVKFSNGIRMRPGEEQGGARPEIVKKQIKETIHAHFEKEWQLKEKGIKVLSLFFIDRVDNYRNYTDTGPKKGIYAEWFEEAYRELAEEYKNAGITILPAEDVHDGYFSKDRKGHFKDTEGRSKLDESTYNLIMKDKEKLLDPQNPLKFIFSHSALREGWDNPNVFQICTLNETVSTLKKRQEIGRGLRLPVNKDGDRVFSTDINNLVVVANESYTDFVAALQNEFEEEGIVFGRLPVEAFQGLRIGKEGEERSLTSEEIEELRTHIQDKGWIDEDGKINEAFSLAVEDHTFVVPEKFRHVTKEIIDIIKRHKIENHVTRYSPKKSKVREDVLLDPEFEKFWNAISQKTIYSVNYQTSDLIKRTSATIKKMEKIEPLKITTKVADISIESSGIKAQEVRTPDHEYITQRSHVPDILSYIQSRVELTRHTIYEILKKSERLDDFVKNPQQFMDASVKCIKDELHKIIIEGIKYERLNEIAYEMSRFRTEEHEKEFINDRIVPTKKSLYEYINYDSNIEKKFAESLESLKDIKYFIKLPAWFKVPTPIGQYNPDWAILKQNGKIVYMIRETKGTTDKIGLRGFEKDKTICGKKHFEAIGIDYLVVTGIEDAQL